MDGRLSAGHSPDFVAAWRGVFCDVYRWRQDGRFAVVPSLLGAPVYAYLPGLNYSDLNAVEARKLAGEMAGHAFNIRALTAPQEELPLGKPAVLRIDLAAFGYQREAVWEQGLRRVKRKAVRRARKAGLRVSEETGATSVKALCTLTAATLARHGAPMMPAALFESLIQELAARVLVVRDRDGAALASLLWVRDGPLAWVPWSGALPRVDVPGDLLFWGMIEQALNERVDIVDFGRSATGDGAYRFKRSFGATPIPVLWLSDPPVDLYRRYATAQKLWRLLPNFVTYRLGPRLCRYLADY